MKISPFSWLALSFLGYYCAYGVFMPFLPVWLQAQGYGDELIGMVLASAYLFRFGGGIFFSSLIRQPSQLIGSLRILAWGCITTVLLMNVVASQFWLVFAVIGLFSLFNAAGFPLGDTLASTWQRQVKLDYGRVRLIGSAAYLIGVLCFGRVAESWGVNQVTWLLCALLLFYALVQWLPPSPLPKGEAQQQQSKVGFVQLLKNPINLRILLAISLIQGSHAAYYAYSVIYWTGQGISLQATSLLWGLSVLAEIVLFFFSNKMFRYWKVSNLLYIVGVTAALRWAILGSSTNLALIALVQISHCITYALGHYAVVRYISSQPQSHIAKLQGLYSGLAGSAAIALFTALAGMLYPISPNLAFYSMILFVFAGLCLIPRQLKGFLEN